MASRISIWLHYGHTEVHKGGWCIPCVLFLTDTALGPSPFINYYNKSKEMRKKHSKRIPLYNMLLMEHTISNRLF